MSDSGSTFPLVVERRETVCPLGEVVGKRMIAAEKIPVIACEGGCFRGEIARRAADLVASEEPFRRGCHGEMFTAPASAMAEWMREAGSVVVIDGCFMRCHGRILKGLVGARLIQFDALPLYNRGGEYTDSMLVDEVPEAERTSLARHVAEQVLARLRRSRAAGPDAVRRPTAGPEAATPGER